MTSIIALRSTVAVRRDARAKRRLLERELAAFNTSADRLELDAMLSRHTTEQTHEIRQILAVQDAVRMTSGRTIGGHRAA
jgi:hypothetical protein